jgi:DNA-binding SARP family transcriptional activator
MAQEIVVEPRFRILGAIEVMGRAGPIRVPPGRPQAILATLLLEPNHVVSVGRLINVIWDSLPPSTARDQVRICVSKLRRAFADAGERCPIVTRAPGYLLQVAEGELDHQVFESGLSRSAVLAREGRLTDAAEAARAALAMWRGPALGGGDLSRELQAQARRLDGRRITAVESWVELKLHLGQHGDVADELTSLVDRYPLRERLRGQLMLALYRSGRQAEALEAYRRGRVLLADELGLDPCDELRAMHTMILRGDSVCASPRRQIRRRPGWTAKPNTRTG